MEPSREAVAGNKILPVGASWDLLMAYHLLLIEEHKKQVKMQEVLDKRKQAASKSSAWRAALSAVGGSISHGNNANKHRSRVENMDPTAGCEVPRPLNTSFMEMDATGIPKTPQATIMATTTYLASHPPPVGD